MNGARPKAEGHFVYVLRSTVADAYTSEALQNQTRV